MEKKDARRDQEPERFGCRNWIHLPIDAQNFSKPNQPKTKALCWPAERNKKPSFLCIVVPLCGRCFSHVRCVTRRGDAND
jgi:hypothetical protein